jgi:hypothetical protein
MAVASSLCGCAELVAAEEANFRVATFSADLTPPLGQPIYSSYEPLATIEHPLLAKGIVLENAGRRYVLAAIDWCTLCNGTHRLFREKLAEAAGTDAGCVTVHTVHQHTAPMGDAEAFEMLDGLSDPPPHPDPQFFRDAALRLADVVRQSIDRIEPFDRVGLGQARVEEVAATRRVLTPEGTIRVRYSSCKDPSLRAEPEGRIDPMLKTVTFARGDKPLVRLHYYATHPQSFYGDPRASYDFPGIARRRLQEKEGVPQVYFTGCAGDVTAGKYNDGSPEARDRLAEHLYAGMEASIASTQWMPAQPIAWRTEAVLLAPRTDAGHALADYQAVMHDAGKSVLRRIDAAQGITFIKRAETPIEISCLAMGPLRLVHLPGESMVEFQLYAQKLLPESFVATAAYGDDGPAYICTEEAFTQGGYEPSASAVAPESEAVLKAAIRKLLSDER